MKAAITLILLTLIQSLVIAAPVAPERDQEASQQTDDAKRGYWWYRDPPPAEKQDKKEPTHSSEREPLGPLPSYSQIMDMHPEEFRKVFKDRMDEAVWRPTPQNVYNWMLVKDVARRKALAFTQVSQFMLLRNPEMNIAPDQPMDDFARPVKVRQMTEERRTMLVNNQRMFALLYFRSETCIYCQAQDNVLKYFQANTGWEIKTIDVDRDAAAAETFGVRVTPTLYLIYRNSKDYMPVGVGPTTANDLEDNIYRAMRFLKGEITPSQFFMWEFERGGTLDPDADPTQYLRVNNDAP